jgi:hypothetical protein
MPLSRVQKVRKTRRSPTGEPASWFTSFSAVLRELVLRSAWLCVLAKPRGGRGPLMGAPPPTQTPFSVGICSDDTTCNNMIAHITTNHHPSAPSPTPSSPTHPPTLPHITTSCMLQALQLSQSMSTPNWVCTAYAGGLSQWTWWAWKLAESCVCKCCSVTPSCCRWGGWWSVLSATYEPWIVHSTGNQASNIPVHLIGNRMHIKTLARHLLVLSNAAGTMGRGECLHDIRQKNAALAHIEYRVAPSADCASKH